MKTNLTDLFHHFPPDTIRCHNFELDETSNPLATLVIQFH